MQWHTVASYSNENFSFKWELPTCPILSLLQLFFGGRKEAKWADLNWMKRSHLNRTLYTVYTIFLSSDILSDDISTNYITQEYGRIRSSMEMGIERAGRELSHWKVEAYVKKCKKNQQFWLRLSISRCDLTILCDLLPIVEDWVNAICLWLRLLNTTSDNPMYHVLGSPPWLSLL